MRSTRWTKQAVNIPRRQLAHSMIDPSLSLETQSNLSKTTKKRYRRSPRSARRTSRTAEAIQDRRSSYEIRGQGRHHLGRGIRTETRFHPAVIGLAQTLLDAEMQTKFVEANGLRFEVLEQGTGDRLALCLHGFPEHAISWRHQIPMLAGMSYRVWAV
jgi:hypothetical protein